MQQFAVLQVNILWLRKKGAELCGIQILMQFHKLFGSLLRSHKIYTANCTIIVLSKMNLFAIFAIFKRCILSQLKVYSIKYHTIEIWNCIYYYSAWTLWAAGLLDKGAFIYDVRYFLAIFDLPTYPHQILYYISLFSNIRWGLTYLHTQKSDVIDECSLR